MQRAFAYISIWMGVLLLAGVFVYLSKTVDTKEGYTENDFASAEKTGTQIVYDRNGLALVEDPALFPVLGHLMQGSTSAGVYLTIDAELQHEVYESLKNVADTYEYKEGAGVIMDVETGELLTLVSFGDDTKNLVTEGLYIPGSIIKPFVAIGALEEGFADPKKEILSTGAIEFFDDAGALLTFKDWKPHGYVDMEKAIGVSSNVYFYAIGGGYEDQEGLGVENIEKYLRMFGIGERTSLQYMSEATGTLPNPAWKAERYHDEWRIADTYMAAIGQHEYLVTPIQMVRAVSALAQDGVLVTPILMRGDTTSTRNIPISDTHFTAVKNGMRYAVENGTAAGLYLDRITLAAKTGTAEVDAQKEEIHSWITGYFPREDPQYAFVFLLAHGPWGEEIGVVSAAKPIFEWIQENRSSMTEGL